MRRMNKGVSALLVLFFHRSLLAHPRRYSPDYPVTIKAIDGNQPLLASDSAGAISQVAGEFGESVNEPEFSLHPRETGPLWRSSPHSPTGLLARGGEGAVVWDEAFYPLATGHWSRGDEVRVRRWVVDEGTGLSGTACWLRARRPLTDREVPTTSTRVVTERAGRCGPARTLGDSRSCALDKLDRWIERSRHHEHSGTTMSTEKGINL